MKLLLVGILALVSFASFAGELQNKKTGEFIQLTLDNESKILNINSNVKDLGIVDVKLENSYYRKYIDIRDREFSDIRLFGTLDNFCNTMADPLVGCAIFFPFAASFLIPDLIMMPVKLPVKLIQDEQYKKDFKILTDVIGTDTLKVVSHRRFERVVQRLKALVKKTL